MVSLVFGCYSRPWEAVGCRNEFPPPLCFFLFLLDLVGSVTAGLSRPLRRGNTMGERRARGGDSAA